VNPKLIIENFGPFEHAEIEYRPLTIFVGRNSVGKSLLLYLTWALSISAPQFEVFERYLTLDESRMIVKLYESIIKSLRKGDDIDSYVKDFMRIFLKLLPSAFLESLRNSLRMVFNVDNLRELVREGTESARVTLEGGLGSCLTVKVKDDVELVDHYMAVDDYLCEVTFKAYSNNTIFFKGARLRAILSISSLADLLKLTFIVISDYLAHLFSLFFLPEHMSALLVDGRAGIARTLLSPYVQNLLIGRGLFYPDLKLSSLYFQLAEQLYEGRIRIEVSEDLLKELGCNVRSVLEGGTFKIYVDTWSRKSLRFERAPSGVREILLVSLALASEENPKIILIEEPEAHLHPRAQKIFAKVVARSINMLNKFIIFTTHSDYIIYSLSNLVALSGMRSKEKLKELGYEEHEVIEPNKVAAYLIRQENDKSIVERLNVTSEGIPEEDFAEIAAEITDERARIYFMRK